MSDTSAPANTNAGEDDDGGEDAVVLAPLALECTREGALYVISSRQRGHGGFTLITTRAGLIGMWEMFKYYTDTRDDPERVTIAAELSLSPAVSR